MSGLPSTQQMRDATDCWLSGYILAGQLFRVPRSSTNIRAGGKGVPFFGWCAARYGARVRDVHARCTGFRSLRRALPNLWRSARRCTAASDLCELFRRLPGASRADVRALWPAPRVYSLGQNCPRSPGYGKRGSGCGGAGAPPAGARRVTLPAVPTGDLQARSSAELCKLQFAHAQGDHPP